MPNFVNRRQIYSFEDTKMGCPILEIPDLFSKKQTLSRSGNPDLLGDTAEVTITDFEDQPASPSTIFCYLCVRKHKTNRQNMPRCPVPSQ